MKKGIIASLLLLLSSTSVLHSEEYLDSSRTPMRFVVNVDGSIQASGAVYQFTANTFRSLAKRMSLKGRTIYFHSRGGLTGPSMEIGHIIRENHMKTVVGQWMIAPTPAGPVTTVLPGVCESMCPFILLAGVKRTVTPGSDVGVHQIWMSTNSPDQNEFSALQVQSIQSTWGKIATYVWQMGGTGWLIQYATSQVATGIRKLTPTELKITHLVK